VTYATFSAFSDPCRIYPGNPYSGQQRSIRARVNREARLIVR
jgi:hypothetical protein